MAKTNFKTGFFRLVIILASLAIGVAIVITFVSNKKPPERIVAAEKQLDVRVVTAEEMPFVISATGFGTAMPDQSWTALSNVKGRVVFRHQDLESGSILSEGSLVLEIDPAIYLLALNEANAEIASIDAEIAQLLQESENVTNLLELERAQLEYSEVELERTTSLVESGTVARATLDVQLKATLKQRQAVQALMNQQNIFPIQHNRLNAQRDRVLAKLAQVQNDLADTKFYAPFDMRVAEVSVELHQYINPGQVLFSGDGLGAAEVVLQIPMQSLRRLLSEIPESDTSLDFSKLGAYVQLVGENQSWEASVVRIANGIDPATRTVRVVLNIEQPGGTSQDFENPPLPKGMYVSGVLQVAALAPKLVIPQSAIHEGWVYLVDADTRLARREVTVAYQQNGLAVIESGLNPGETVILDDIVPAISGTLLNPFADETTTQLLREAAVGELP